MSHLFEENTNRLKMNSAVLPNLTGELSESCIAGFDIMHPLPDYLNATKSIFGRLVNFRFCMQRWDPTILPYQIPVEDYMRSLFINEVEFRKRKQKMQACEYFLAYELRRVEYDMNCVPEVAVIGPWFSGKGTFLWSLFRQKCRCRQTMFNERTRYLNFFRVGYEDPCFHFVDTPGYHSENFEEWNELVMTYLATSTRLKIVILLLDINDVGLRGLGSLNEQVLAKLEHYQIPHLVVFSKKDKLPDELVNPWIAMISNFMLPKKSKYLIPYNFATSCLFEDSHVRAVQGIILEAFLQSNMINTGSVFQLRSFYDNDDRYEQMEMERIEREVFPSLFSSAECNRFVDRILKNKDHFKDGELQLIRNHRCCWSVDVEAKSSSDNFIDLYHDNYPKRVVDGTGIKVDLRQNGTSFQRPSAVQLISPLEAIIDRRNKDMKKLPIYSFAPGQECFIRSPHYEEASKVKNILGLNDQFDLSLSSGSEPDVKVKVGSSCFDNNRDWLDEESLGNEFAHIDTIYDYRTGNKL